jgi:MFS family permease
MVDVSFILITSLAMLLLKRNLAIMCLLVVLFGIILGPMWPVTVMISNSVFGSEQLTANIIGAGAIGSALGPFLGSFVLSHQGSEGYFNIQFALSFSIFLICFAAYRRAARFKKDC